MIRIRGLRKSYGGAPVLDDVHAEAAAGSVVALLGGSGSGKSTLLRCLNGLTPFEAGEVEVAGFRLRGGNAPPQAELLALRAAVGMVFQELHLFPHLTALENVTLAPRVVGKVSRTEAERQARALLEHVGMADRSDARPASLSGGQKQRVAIARAVAQGARVLLLDEPTSALDASLRGDVAELLRKLAQGEVAVSSSEQPLTLVVVTHDESFARQIGTVTWSMERGRVTVRGS